MDQKLDAKDAKEKQKGREEEPSDIQKCSVTTVIAQDLGHPLCARSRPERH